MAGYSKTRFHCTSKDKCSAVSVSCFVARLGYEFEKCETIKLECTTDDAEGNVVLGYCSKTFLMLDVDNQNDEEYVGGFAKRYTRFHHLGSTLVIRTSEDLRNMYGNTLKHFGIIFGKPLSWREIKWHVREAYRLGMVDEKFLNLRKFGYITIRVNAKNNMIPCPRISYYYRNGDRTGIFRYIRFYVMCKKLGREEDN